MQQWYKILAISYARAAFGEADPKRREWLFGRANRYAARAGA
jgi:hypothetical protein